MKEFIDKLIGRLEEKTWYDGPKTAEDIAEISAYKNAIQIVKELAEEHKADKVNQLAMMYAQNMYMYGVDVTKAWETTISQSAALNKAYMRGRQDEIDRFVKWKEEHKGGWIPCSERLPDTDGWYYTTEKYGNIVVSGMCKFRNGKWEHCDSDITTIAWQCKPQPYKEREEVPIEM